jgi:hypothetical protein
MRVHRLAKGCVTRKVHVDGGCIRSNLVQLVVGQHAVVTAQAFAKRHIAGRGEPHDFNPLALGQLKGRAIGCFAGCAR